MIDAEAFHPDYHDLVIGIAPLEKLAGGHRWCEGPVYFPTGDFVLWSDIPNNRIMQWAPELGWRVYSHQSNNSNGLTRDRQGRLIACEHLTRSVVRYGWNGERTVLADTYNNKRLNSPNDAVVKSDGSIWFTDPPYGILSVYEGTRSPQEQSTCNVYRLGEDGALDAMIDTIARPNGLAFSPDESVLYVADSSRSHDPDGGHHVHAFDVGQDGELANQRIFASIEHGVPDGLRVDEFGNVWCSSKRGVETFAPYGRHLGCIHVPEAVANLTFGGPKGNRLFIAATTTLYAKFVAVRGADWAGH